jgi:hypothetical protein
MVSGWGGGFLPATSSYKGMVSGRGGGFLPATSSYKDLQQVDKVYKKPQIILVVI